MDKFKVKINLIYNLKTKATIFGDINAVQKQLDDGTYINTKDKYNRTALHYCKLVYIPI
jgi:ankyrin repeat protein